MLITFYELINANSTFQHLISNPLSTCLSNESPYTEDITLCAFISFSSYLLQTPRSKRSVAYGKLVLLTFLRICEDNTLCKLFFNQQLMGVLRLCRQVTTMGSVASFLFHEPLSHISLCSVCLLCQLLTSQEQFHAPSSTRCLFSLLII